MSVSATNFRKSTWLALILLLLLLMLPNLVWWWHDKSLAVCVEALIIPAVLLSVFYGLLGNFTWLACLLLAPLALLAPLEVFFVAKYHHPTSAEVIATLVATNPSEVHEYLGSALTPLLACLLGTFAIAIFAAYRCAIDHVRWHNKWRMRVLVIAIATPLVALGISVATTKGSLSERQHSISTLSHTLNGTVALGYPFGLFQRVVQYHEEWTSMRADAARLDSFNFRAHRLTQAHTRQIYVLVIGESSRRNHWQLFGYQRKTNPELSHTANLVPISHLLTSWPMSLGAIPLILTRKPITRSDLGFNEASVLRAMQEAGYDTWWISNQMAIGQYDSPISTIAYQAQHVVWLNHASWNAPDSYDRDLLQPLHDAIHNSNHDLFIVLHMMGSHLKYDDRYPPAFERFRPTLSNTSTNVPTGIRMQNSYDNTILYTDHVLASIIGTLSRSGATTALWYESDHGEMLVTPTCDFAGHGIGTVYEYQIPALFWYSNAYERQFPDKVAMLRNNSDKRALSADTFESLIDMAGVDFHGHDETWSLFSPQWRYRPRIVNAQMWRTDFDKAKIGKKCPFVIPP